MSFMERLKAVRGRLSGRFIGEPSSFSENTGLEFKSSGYFNRLFQRMAANQQANDERASQGRKKEKRAMPARVASIVASTTLFAGPLPHDVFMQRISSESRVTTTVVPQPSAFSTAERFSGEPALDVRVSSQTGRTTVTVQRGPVKRAGEVERVRVAKRNSAEVKPAPISKVDFNIPEADQRVRFAKRNSAEVKPAPISKVDFNIPEADQRVRFAKRNSAEVKPAPIIPEPEANCEDEFCPINPEGHMLGREAARAFRQAQKEAGVEIVVASALRTREHQQRLFDCWLAGVEGCNPANPPGISYHEPENGALAVDVENHEDPVVNEALKRNGFNQPFPHDPREDHHFCFLCNG
jgi:hypothetical protein